MIIDHFELTKGDNLSVEEKQHELMGIKNRAKENLRMSRLLPAAKEYSAGDYESLTISGNVLEGWDHDPMILPPGANKLRFFKSLTSGIIQTVHNQLNETEKNNFVIKPVYDSINQTVGKLNQPDCLEII